MLRTAYNRPSVQRTFSYVDGQVFVPHSVRALQLLASVGKLAEANNTSPIGKTNQLSALVLRCMHALDDTWYIEKYIYENTPQRELENDPGLQSVHAEAPAARKQRGSAQDPVRRILTANIRIPCAASSRDITAETRLGQTFSWGAAGHWMPLASLACCNVLRSAL